MKLILRSLILLIGSLSIQALARSEAFNSDVVYEKFAVNKNKQQLKSLNKYVRQAQVADGGVAHDLIDLRVTGAL